MNNKEKIDGVTPPKDLDEMLTRSFPTTQIGSGVMLTAAQAGYVGSFYEEGSKKSQRMKIAIEAMKALLAKDFKNIGFSAFNNSKQNPAQYIADQSFILSDAMIERENKKEVEDEEK